MTGEELRNYRQAKGLTQMALGLALGYKGKTAENTIQFWEADKRPISPKKFKLLSDVLGIPLDKLVV